MPVDRRSRQKAKTFACLRLSALQLVDEHGLDHVTIEMIAEAADVSPRTFFNYFTSKEAALLGPGSEAGDEVARFWAGRPAGEAPLTTLRLMVLERVTEIGDHSEVMDLRMRVLGANPVLYARFHAGFLEIERAVRVEVARRCGLDADHDLYPRLLAAAGGAAIRSSMDLWREGDPRPLVEIVDEAFHLYLTGLDTIPPTGDHMSHASRPTPRLGGVA